MYRTAKQFRSWLQFNCPPPLCVEFQSDCSATIDVSENHQIRGTVCRMFPAMGGVIIRLWSPRCYFLEWKFVGPLITLLAERAMVPPFKTPTSLSYFIENGFPLEECIEFHVSLATDLEDLELFDGPSMKPLSCKHLVTLLTSNSLRLELSSDELYARGLYNANLHLVEMDDGLVLGVAKPEMLNKLVEITQSKFSVFDGLGKRLS